MKLFYLVIILVYVGFNSSYGQQTAEIYPGSLIKKELIAIRSNPFLKVSFIGKKYGELAFKFEEFDRQVFEEKPVYEKLKVVRERGDINDSGQRHLIPGEFIIGPIEKREEQKKISPVASVNFHYLGVTSQTDAAGILTDNQQVILSQFENLRDLSAHLEFKSENYEPLELELTRSNLYEKLGIHYGITKQSHPENLKFYAQWDKSVYRPGNIARLTIMVKNSADSGGVFRLLARSISRWPWLDGKMYYIGDLKAGEERQLMRIFHIPPTEKEGLFCLRIGFNDHSGAKPQLPLSIEILN